MHERNAKDTAELVLRIVTWTHTEKNIRATSAKRRRNWKHRLSTETHSQGEGEGENDEAVLQDKQECIIKVRLRVKTHTCAKKWISEETDTVQNHFRKKIEKFSMVLYGSKIFSCDFSSF